MKSKVKLKGQVTSQQDSLLQEKQRIIDKGFNEIHSLKHEVDHLKTDNESLKKKVGPIL
jgi:chaperonin cofactor prefoldin